MNRLTEEQGKQLRALALMMGSIDCADTTPKSYGYANRSAFDKLLQKIVP